MTIPEAGVYIQGRMEKGLERDEVSPSLDECMQDHARRLARSAGFDDGSAEETAPGEWTIWLTRHPREYVIVDFTIDNKTTRSEER